MIERFKSIWKKFWCSHDSSDCKDAGGIILCEKCGKELANASEYSLERH